jgi:Na+/H+ antiporter NhaD/arsenite permease-like protein
MQFIKYSSLEVVIGAVLYQCFLNHVYFNAFPQNVEILALSLVIWLIYLLDRQIDNLFQPAEDARHRYYFTNRKFMRLLIGCIFLFITFLLPFLPYRVLLAGFCLVGCIVLYAYSWHKRLLRSEKELVTAVLYGLGVSLVVWVKEPRSILFVLPLILLAYQNLCYLNLLEEESVFYRNRRRKTEWIVMGLLGGLYVATQELFIILPFLVTFGLTILFSLSKLPEEKRNWADLAFWSPLIYFLHGFFSK